MSVAGIEEARLRVQRAALLDERDALAELDEAVELLVGESGAVNRTNREWLAGEAYELLATVEDFRRNAQAAAEARRHGCDRYREVERDPSQPAYPGRKIADEAGAAIDRLCEDQAPSD